MPLMHWARQEKCIVASTLAIIIDYFRLIALISADIFYAQVLFEEPMKLWVACAWLCAKDFIVVIDDSELALLLCSETSFNSFSNV